jgi:hypothetical protein
MNGIVPGYACSPRFLFECMYCGFPIEVPYPFLDDLIILHGNVGYYTYKQDKIHHGHGVMVVIPPPGSYSPPSPG